MNKTDLTDKIANDYDLTKALARDIVENIFETLADSIKKGDDVAIAGFGGFRLADRAAREGRNPSTGDVMKIPASKTIKFRPAAPLKTAINEKKRTSGKAGAKAAAKSTKKKT